MRKVLLLALGAAVIAAGCNDDAAKANTARQEIGVQTGVLMQKNVIPKDQAAFDDVTKVAGCPTDPWGHPYVYDRIAFRKIKVRSLGPDGKKDTPDDVIVDLEFPPGTGLADMTVTRPDGTAATKSPDGKHTFWTTQKEVGAQQVTDYWLGDGSANAKSPFKTDKVNVDDYRRGVTLVRWSEDGRYLTYKDSDSASRPDGQSKETTTTVDVTTGKEVAAPPSTVAWIDY